MVTFGETEYLSSILVQMRFYLGFRLGVGANLV